MLKEGEKIQQIFCVNWTAYIFLLGIFFIGLLITILLVYFFFHIWWLYLLFIIPTWHFFILFLYIWYIHISFQTIIMSNYRIWGYKRISFFEYIMVETSFEDIAEIKVIKKGYFASLFHYGNLEIISFSQNNNISMKYLPQPNIYAKQLQTFLDEQDEQEEN